MRRALIAVVFSIVAPVAMAQQQPSKPLPGMALLDDPQVQRELKLDEAQIAAIRAGTVRIGDEARNMIHSLRNATAARKQDRHVELQKFVIEANQKLVIGTLRPEQLTRLSQIENQIRGWLAFEDPGVQKFLNLSTEQKAKVAAFQAESIEAAKSLGRAFPNDAATRKARLAEAERSIRVRALAILDGDQQLIWKKLTGEPFAFQATPSR